MSQTNNASPLATMPKMLFIADASKLSDELLVSVFSFLKPRFLLLMLLHVNKHFKSLIYTTTAVTAIPNPMLMFENKLFARQWNRMYAIKAQLSNVFLKRNLVKNFLDITAAHHSLPAVAHSTSVPSVTLPIIHENNTLAYKLQVWDNHSMSANQPSTVSAINLSQNKKQNKKSFTILNFENTSVHFMCSVFDTNSLFKERDLNEAEFKERYAKIEQLEQEKLDLIAKHDQVKSTRYGIHSNNYKIMNVKETVDKLNHSSIIIAKAKRKRDEENMKNHQEIKIGNELTLAEQAILDYEELNFAQAMKPRVITQLMTKAFQQYKHECKPYQDSLIHNMASNAWETLVQQVSIVNNIEEQPLLSRTGEFNIEALKKCDMTHTSNRRMWNHFGMVFEQGTIARQLKNQQSHLKNRINALRANEQHTPIHIQLRE